MTGDEFARLLGDFTLSAESGDGPIISPKTLSIMTTSTAATKAAPISRI
jgi:hypothetical protein